MCAMDPCLTPLGSPKSRALSHHKALEKINPIKHSIVAVVVVANSATIFCTQALYALVLSTWSRC